MENTSHQYSGMRRIICILVLSSLGTAALTVKSENNVNIKNLKRNNPLRAPSSASSLTFPKEATQKFGTEQMSPFSYVPFSYVPFSYVPYSYVPFSYVPYSYVPISYVPFSYVPYPYVPFSYVPISHVFKTKNRKGGRGVLSQACRFKHYSKCPRNTRFLGAFHVKEAEESDWVRIGRKIIEQGVLQALALDWSYLHNPTRKMRI